MSNHYQEALKIARMGLWEWNVKTNETKWGDEKFLLFGYEPNEFEVNLENAFKTVHSEDHTKIFKILEENMPTKDYFDYEYRGIKKSGEIIHVWVQLNVIRDEFGIPDHVLGTSQDITERTKMVDRIKNFNEDLEIKVSERTKALEKKNCENELLLKEIHHRVKNNLQVISSILHLQMSHLDDESATETLFQCIQRINSMAIIHESLYHQDNLEQIYLDSYVDSLFNLHVVKENNISIYSDVPKFPLSIVKMVPIGLLLNELISNSMKHAFQNMEHGRIDLHISNTDKFVINYKDNGKGMDTGLLKEKASFGMELIETLCEGLEANYHFKSGHNKGTEFNLETVLDDI